MAGTVTRRIEGEYSYAHFDAPIAGTDSPAYYQAEIWGPSFTITYDGVPPGEYALTLGLSENFQDGPGRRIFSATANGEEIVRDLDIFAEVGKFTALDVTKPIRVPDGRLVLHLEASRDAAKLSFVRLASERYVLFDPVVDYGDKSVKNPDPFLPVGDMYETIVARFGSRLAYNPRPQRNTCFSGAMGRQLDENLPVLMACRAGGRLWALPLAAGVPVFKEVRQSCTLTRLSWEATSPACPLEVAFEFVSPFYPEDLETTLAPFFYLEISARNRTAEPAEAEIVFGDSAFAKGAAPFEGGLLVEEHHADRRCQRALVPLEQDERLTFSAEAPPLDWNQPRKKDEKGREVLTVLPVQAFPGATWRVRLGPGEEDSTTLIIAAYVAEPVLEVQGKPYRFKYTQLFGDLSSVIEFARARRENILGRCDLFDSTLLEASIDDDARELLAFSFASLASNAWYCIGEEGDDWFSVWEGVCRFHSTVDVEYNDGLVYYQYWPRLVAMLLDEWPRFRDGRVISHDMGGDLKVNGMVYPHHMPVEENTNYVLMAHHYWKLTGEFAPLARNFGAIADAVAYCIDSDTTGNGFPDEGTANTVDQGSAAIQFSKEQTYLAVRCLAAYTAFLEMAAEHGDDAGLAEAVRREMDEIRRTLEEEAWLGDHYAVCLHKEQGELADVWTGKRLSEGELPGWDAYSIYASNGLLYPMRSGLAVPFDRGRMLADIRNATEATMRRFGSPHSSIEDNMWISQNMWRDFAAAYLGDDMLSNMSRYWELVRYMNRCFNGCFTDVYVYGADTISLSYYPRGTTGFGLLYALGGVQIDATRREIWVAPVRDYVRVPLSSLADWERGAIPWLTLRRTESGVSWELEGAEHLEGWTVREGRRFLP